MAQVAPAIHPAITSVGQLNERKQTQRHKRYREFGSILRNNTFQCVALPGVIIFVLLVIAIKVSAAGEENIYFLQRL